MYFEALASGGGSDWFYTILMKAPSGASITVDDGDEELYATGAGMSNIIGVPVHNPSSTYTISVEMNGLTAPTQTENTPATSGGISSVLEFPFAQLDITFDDNFRSQTMSMTDGTHSANVTLPASGNTVSVYVPYTGDWTLTAIDPVSGNSFNSSPNPVPVSSLTQVINVGLYVIPDGSTVLPTDDIETWLLCADIKNTGYTTLDEVLADEDVLFKLLTDNNANDYLVRSKTWSVNPGIPESELAMSYIGAYDYAADTLLSDSDWFDAIIKSDYVRSVFNVYPPLLSANNTAIANASSVYQNDPTNYGAWKAFDGVTAGLWHASATGAQWISYTFNSVKKASYTSWNCQHPTRIVSYKIQGYNGSAWVDLTEALTASLVTGKNIIQHTKNIGDYISYRLNIINSVNNPPTAHELIFLGRNDAGVQTLLKAAGLSKHYTTIDELLADHESLQRVISSHDAIDYLVTAKGFIDAFTSDAFTMRCIGLRNYAADTLLGDSDWRTAICNSTYYGSVLNTKVPTMTSKTQPSGECVSSGTLSNYPEFKAFDAANPLSDASDSRAALTSQTNCWLGYHFPNKVKVAIIELYNYTSYAAYSFNNGIIQASNDGINWDDITTSFNLNKTTLTGNFYLTKLIASNVGKYEYYRFYSANGGMVTNPSLNTIQFYGREDVDETKVTIIGASGASIYYKNAGVDTPIATLTGTEAEVSKSALPSGNVVLYSTIAKNQTDISKDFAKLVNIDSDTIAIEMMQEGEILYWYGYKGPKYKNPGTLAGATNVQAAPETTNYLGPMTTNYQYVGGYGESKTVNNVYGDISTPSSIDNTFILTNDVDNNTMTYRGLASKIKGTRGFESDDVNNPSEYSGTFNPLVYPIRVNSRPTIGGYIYSLLYDRLGSKPTFISAAHDVLYILDGSEKVPIAFTNGSGLSYNMMLEPGTYDIYSSVAKDPNNLSNPYHKVVTITPDMFQVKIMPDHVIYWFGYKGDEFEACTSDNGWSPSPQGFGSMVDNGTSLTLNSGAGQTSCGIASKQKHNNITAKGIGKGITLSSGTSGGIAMKSSKSLADAGSTGEGVGFTSTNIQTISVPVTIEGYISAMAAYYRSCQVNALWYE